MSNPPRNVLLLHLLELVHHDGVVADEALDGHVDGLDVEDPDALFEIGPSRPVPGRGA